MDPDKTVLSIQSHVTHGYVGNKVAVFALQLHGFEVDAVNTVSLSNHSGYPVIRGHRMTLEEYHTLFDGLRANDFLTGYHYIVSGYINNPEIIAELSTTVREIRTRRAENYFSAPIYLCDPVMGDNGVLYCKPEVLEAYRGLLPHVDVLTPNYFEATLLSGVEVKDLRSAQEAAMVLHRGGARCVVIKSFPILGEPTQLQFLISTTDLNNNNNPNDNTDKDNNRIKGSVKQFTGRIQRYEGHYTGTGDLFAAAFLAFYHNHPVEVAVGRAMGVMQEVIERTFTRSGGAGSSLNARELRPTDNAESLLRPKKEVAVERLQDD